MAKFQGFVNKLTTKEGTGSRGKWTLYSFVVEQDDGDISPWISFGFAAPPFAEGDYIAFETDEKDGRHNYKKGSGSKPANPPERAKARTSNTGAGSGNQKAAGATAAVQGTNGADRQTSIVMQHSQEMAILAAGVLLTHNALPMSGAASKAGEAKRFSEITAMIDKLTVKFYNDAATGRLLDTVADTVIDTAADAALPGSTIAGQKPAAPLPAGKKRAPVTIDATADDLADDTVSTDPQANGF
jgi:hypothetical protein